MNNTGSNSKTKRQINFDNNRDFCKNNMERTPINNRTANSASQNAKNFGSMIDLSATIGGGYIPRNNSVGNLTNNTREKTTQETIIGKLRKKDNCLKICNGF